MHIKTCNILTLSKLISAFIDAGTSPKEWSDCVEFLKQMFEYDTEVYQVFEKSGNTSKSKND